MTSSTTFRKSTLAMVALAACLAGTAMAQPRPDGRGPDRDPRAEQQMRQGPGQRDMRDDHRGPGRGPDRFDERRADRHDAPQPRAEWRRGGRVPAEYRGRNYVVDDWRGHRLQQPPRGYHWVGVGGDYVLAAIAGGLIAQIVNGQ